MNELSIIPDLCIKEVNFILNVKIYINGELREVKQQPFFYYRKLTRTQRDLYIFYSKFIYKSRRYNPIQPLLNINKELNNIEWLKTFDITIREYTDYEGEIFKNSKFITTKQETIYPKTKPYQTFDNITTKPIKVSDYKIVVEYLSIREEIISFLIQKYADNKYIQTQVNTLRPLFNNTGEITDYETAMNKRIDYLKGLDYQKYSEILNCSPTELQRQRDERNGNNT